MKSTKMPVKSKKTYGPKLQDHLMVQYKIFVESIERSTDRRHAANNYFLTLNTALIYLIGISFQFESFDGVSWLRPLSSIVGVIICLVYSVLINSYKKLNRGKFLVVDELEKHLPAAIYKYEWTILKKGKDFRTYYSFSNIEMIVPAIFAVIYLTLFILFAFG